LARDAAARTANDGAVLVRGGFLRRRWRRNGRLSHACPDCVGSRAAGSRHRAPRALRPAGSALHLVPGSTTVHRGFRARRIPRALRAQQRAHGSAAALALRARPVLLQPLFLLRLQPPDHRGHFAGRALRQAAAARDRTGGAALRPRTRGGAAAPGGWHAEFPRCRDPRMADRAARQGVQPQPLTDTRLLHRARPADGAARLRAGTGAARVQPRQSRRSGLRPGGAARRQPTAEHRPDARSHRRLPRPAARCA